MAKVITKIEAQKRKGRYNVYLDNQYAFPVAESVLIKYRLTKGMEVDDDLAAEITTADSEAKAYGRMLDYLSHQLRTEAEVQQKLLEEDTPPDTSERVMAHLRADKLLDDDQYAGAYVRTAMNTTLKGPTVIRQKLRQKGVGELVIDRALKQFTPARQKENARKLAKKLYRRYAKQPPRRQEEKVRQGLITNGYPSDLFSQVKDVAPAVNEDKVQTLIDREGEKAERRYRHYSGYERRQRVKQALFRKGFDYDDIEHWLANRGDSASD